MVLVLLPLMWLLRYQSSGSISLLVYAMTYALEDLTVIK